MEEVAKHIVLVRAKNDLTVLNRIITVLRKRRFALEMFNVNLCEEENEMQVTVVLDAEKKQLNQVMCQLDKLIEVYETQEITYKKGHALLDFLIVTASIGLEEKLKSYVQEKDCELVKLNFVGGEGKVTYSFVGDLQVIEKVFLEVKKLEDIKILRSGVMARV